MIYAAETTTATAKGSWSIRLDHQVDGLGVPFECVEIPVERNLPRLRSVTFPEATSREDNRPSRACGVAHRASRKLGT